MARPRSDIAPKILRSARKHFLYDGVDGASLRKIAADAGTSIGMIYYYFRTKDDLFLAIVEEVYARLLAEIETLMDPALSAAERMRRVFLRFGALSDEEAAVLLLIVREALAGPRTRIDRILARFSRGHIPLLLGQVMNGIAAGELRDDLPAPAITVASLALAIFPQLMHRRVGNRTPFSAAMPTGAQLATALCELLLTGATPREPKPPRRR